VWRFRPFAPICGKPCKQQNPADVIQAYTRRGTGTVRVITPYGSLTIDQILGRQGDDTRR
jgi:hypothetical protein